MRCEYQYDVRIYKPYKEWEGYEQQLAENGIEIIDFGLDKRFKNLSSEGIGYRISMLIISFFSFGIMKKNMEEDRPEVIQAAFDNITEGIERKTFKVGKL